ncbi:MAG: hypothetical protein WDZ85_01415 [Candidatus Paceibacterota bacterium]
MLKNFILFLLMIVAFTANWFKKLLSFSDIFVKADMSEVNWPYNLKIIKAVGIILASMVALASLLSWIFNWGFGPPIGLMAFSAIYILGGFRVVDGDKDRGGIVIFGYIADHVVDSGIVFVPPIIGRLERVTRQVIQKELPGKNTWHGQDAEGRETPIPQELMDQYDAPIRITCEDSDPPTEKNPEKPHLRLDPLLEGNYPFTHVPGEPGEDPLRKRVAVRVSPIMRFRVVNVIRFLKTFRNQQEAIEQVGDMVISETTAAIQIGTYARALANMEGLGQLVSDKLIERLYQGTGFKGVELSDRSIPNTILFSDQYPLKKRASIMSVAVVNFWGILVLPVQIKSFGPSKKLNIAVQSIAEGRAAGRVGVEEAAGIRAKTAAVMEGLNDGLKGFPAEDKMTILAIEAAKRGMETGPMIVAGPDGFSQILAMGKAAAAAMETDLKKKPKEKEEEPGKETK